MSSVEYFYKVRFKYPPLDENRTEYYFMSLAAIYGLFTPSEIGCKVERLWACHVAKGVPYKNKRCIITKHEAYRMPQKSRDKRIKVFG